MCVCECVCTCVCAGVWRSLSTTPFCPSPVGGSAPENDTGSGSGHLSFGGCECVSECGHYSVSENCGVRVAT